MKGAIKNATVTRESDGSKISLKNLVTVHRGRRWKEERQREKCHSFF